MKRKRVSVLLAILFVSLLQLAEAQQPGKVPRMGYLASGTSRASPNAEALRQGLRDLGYVEEQNIAIEYRSSEGKTDRLPGLAAELVRLKVDIIFAAGGDAGRAAKKATSAIPIIFVGTPDPVASRLVASLARPGGNVTGFSNGAPGLYGKRLEIIKETLPQTRPRERSLESGLSIRFSVKRDALCRTRVGRAGSISRGAEFQRYRSCIRGGNQGASWRASRCAAGTHQY